MELNEKEKNLIQAIAEKGPLTGYDIHKKKMIMSNAHWERVKDRIGPEGLNLIFEIKTDGVSKPYWLTPLGFCCALQCGADPDLVVENAKGIFNEKQMKAARLYSEFAKLSQGPALLGLLGDAMACNKDGGDISDVLLKAIHTLKIEMMEPILQVVSSDPEFMGIFRKEMAGAVSSLRERGLLES